MLRQLVDYYATTKAVRALVPEERPDLASVLEELHDKVPLHSVFY